MAPRFRAALGLLGLTGALLSASAAHAQWSAGQSVFTTEGVEVAVDPRVFALYAMLNGSGYDTDAVHGPAPLFKPSFTEVRKKVRSSLGRPGQAMKAFGAVLEKNPVGVEQYLAAALELGQAPGFEVRAQASPLARALAAPLRTWFNEDGGAALLRTVADDAKPAQKKLLPKLDAAIKATTAAIRLGDTQEQLLDDSAPTGRVVVVLNELDGHGTLARATAGGVTYIVAGPASTAVDDDVVVTAATVAYARSLVARDIEKAAGAGTVADAYAGLNDVIKRTLPSAGAYASEVVACGFAKSVRNDAPCEASPLLLDLATEPAVKAVAPRIKAFASDSRTLNEAAPALLAASDKQAEKPADKTPADKTAPAATPTKGAKKGGR